jgi:hypothetical protein
VAQANTRGSKQVKMNKVAQDNEPLLNQLMKQVDDCPCGVVWGEIVCLPCEQACRQISEIRSENDAFEIPERKRRLQEPCEPVQ